MSQAGSAISGAIDYRIPTSMDLPTDLRSDVVENADGPGPYGAKGMSEGALLAVAPAVAAAVTQATGAVIRDLPLTPERVWRALKGRPQSVPQPCRTPANWQRRCSDDYELTAGSVPAEVTAGTAPAR